MKNITIRKAVNVIGLVFVIAYAGYILVGCTFAALLYGSFCGLGWL